MAKTKIPKKALFQPLISILLIFWVVTKRKSQKTIKKSRRLFVLTVISQVTIPINILEKN